MVMVSLRTSDMLLVVASVPLIWLLYSTFCLLRNYLRARSVGIPLVVLPISPENPIWMLVDKAFFVPVIERLPLNLGRNNVTRYNWRGWEFQDKYKSHLELGDIFMTVSPGRNTLYVCNAETAEDIFKRRLDFQRPVELLGA